MAATIAHCYQDPRYIRCIRAGRGLSFRQGSVNPDAVLIP